LIFELRGFLEKYNPGNGLLKSLVEGERCSFLLGRIERCW